MKIRLLFGCFCLLCLRHGHIQSMDCHYTSFWAGIYLNNQRVMMHDHVCILSPITHNVRFPFHAVAGRVENVVVTQIPSFSPTLNVSWSPATEGAPVTGYTVHYTSSGVGGGNEHNESVFTIGNESSAVIDNLLADGRAYSVVVEAHSLHFSSFSQPTSYTPCEFTIAFSLLL